MKYIMVFLINITWGILQSLVGFVGFLWFGRRPHYWYKGSIVTVVKGNWGGISLGAFIFIDEDIKKDKAPVSLFVNHEYGHCIQSLLLGPLYLFIIGLPSMVWARFFDGYRRRKKINYYDFYTERWAEVLGTKTILTPAEYSAIRRGVK